MDAGLARGGGAMLFDFAFDGAVWSGVPASLGRVECREKSGIPRGDFFFMESPPRAVVREGPSAAGRESAPAATADGMLVQARRAATISAFSRKETIVPHWVQT